ncbi:MAG: hypothetical protein AAFZ14_01720 [Pseudomonadota bacterium]
MFWLRFLMVTLIVLTAPVSGAMEAAHGDHPAAEHMMHADAECCDAQSERAPQCHACLALVPMPGAAALDGTASGHPVIDTTLTLTGIDPAAPLDPPRG